MIYAGGLGDLHAVKRGYPTSESEMNLHRLASTVLHEAGTAASKFHDRFISTLVKVNMDDEAMGIVPGAMTSIIGALQDIASQKGCLQDPLGCHHVENMQVK